MFFPGKRPGEWNHKTQKLTKIYFNMMEKDGVQKCLSLNKPNRISGENIVCLLIETNVQHGHLPRLYL